ncbi:conserved membrane hypothetical protein [uncultured Desulfatiglans sp.]|uniref:UPF0182 protein TRIP_B330350 n=1 Tax=Uncultured Desulfatiglans sp. TaxID=1748965 RepID=A0A653A894_UNCDX|nr:conserved membrane hypothetical protein [uncultured Desulfatiglans sp.]
MKNFFGPENPGGEMPQIRIEDLDFAKFRRTLRWILLLLGAIFLVRALAWGLSFYTDLLWFEDLGYRAVLMKVLSSRVFLFAAGSMIFAAFAAVNLFLAYRLMGGLSALPGANLPPAVQGSARKLLMLSTIVIVILGALLLGARPASRWETMLLFMNGQPFNEIDPIFQKDLSFFIFTLPALAFVRSWCVTLVAATLLVCAAFYYVAAPLRGERFVLQGRVKRHLAVLGALLFLLIAAGHWLGRYELLYSQTGAVYGVGYTDSHVTLPALGFLAVVAILCAAALLAASFLFRRNMVFLYIIGAWVALNLVAGSLIPMLVQRLQVEPSELARERPFLAHNIAHTRKAYGLSEIETRSHPARGEIDAATVAANQGTISNVRLWDEGPLLQSYNQIQFFRLYYDFLAVHTDRYIVEDTLRQVMLATRELSAEKLPEEAQRWVNRHLQFTHGYGVAVSPVTEVAAGGRPSFLIKNVPPAGEIQLNRPEIYFGLKSLDFLIVRSKMQEFNYPGPDGPVYTRYGGEGGVALNSFFRRLVYALKFADLNILISGEIQPESLIQYRRTVQERFTSVTPFLLRDREAYSVVADGRLFWIQDAYTYTQRYPYATPWERRFNYLRNSVKAVVDAYHGSIDYYVCDPADPLIRAYQAIFPNFFKPITEMPDFLRAHTRYPLDLFTVQTEMLLQYHMEDAIVFYNKEDQWSIPVQSSFGEAQALKPYYIVGRLPGEAQEEFLLIQPFTPSNRHNLVGWIAARSDGDRYGEMLLFRFPTGRHVDGPNQVEARIDNDAVISEQFTLWGQVGSEIFRGILLVIPVGDAVLYAEPVFLKPETLDFPELRRIILADSRQVVMHKTMEASIQALVGEGPAIAPMLEEDQALIDAGAPSGPGFEGLERIQEGLQEVVGRLQELLQELKRMSPGSNERKSAAD